MTSVTTIPSYWLNWRFLLCAIGIIFATVFSAILIWRYEGFKDSERDDRREKAGIVYKDESWKPCSKKIHPVWLLAYRVIALCILLAVLISNIVVHSIRILYFYYTEWTFTLVILYFALGCIFSIYGCLSFHNEVGGGRMLRSNADKGTYTDESCGDNEIMFTSHRSLNSGGESRVSEFANVWGYAFQIIFQICAGAVVLTDIVFWTIIYPFLTGKDYKLHLLNVSEHSINAILLLVDVCLNSLCFPFFRVAYFVLWTTAFVVFQWIFHAFVSTGWPYAFLDLSSRYAPIWYLAIGLFTLPCFCVFALIFKIKKWCWSRIPPQSSLNLR